MRELGYQQAVRLEERIRNILYCSEGEAVPMSVEPTKVPRTDLESTIFCKAKTTEAKYNTYHCAVIE